MNTRFLVAVAFYASLAIPAVTLPAVQAQSSQPSPTPSYHFVRGETLRYLIQRDPYFADPKAAIETVVNEAYRPPVVERLTEKVLAVAADGAATLTLTLAPEPGFEDPDHPQAAISRTVSVTASGRVVSSAGPQPQDSPEAQDLLRGIVSFSPALSVRNTSMRNLARKDGLAVEDRSSPPVVIHSTSPDHDGTLLQTTSVAQSDHVVFDCRRGELVRAVSTETITLSLVMTGRGRRGSDDFGHVVPNSEVVQTLTVERQAN